MATNKYIFCIALMLTLTLFPTAYRFPLCYGEGENTPPAKNIFQSVIFQFFYTHNESYVQLAKIKTKIKKKFKNGQEIEFLKNFRKIFGNLRNHENVRHSVKFQYFEL